MSDEKVPKWVSFDGAHRLQAEYRAVSKAIANSKLPQLSALTLHNDNLFEWRFNISNFDPDVQAGRDLNNDLRRLPTDYGLPPAIAMALTFPPSYPNDPPFLRVIRPRMVMYTGHVTAGGSICIESLTHSGGPHAWQRNYTVESMVLLVMNNMLHCDRVYVKTATGPGGQSGPLRVDFRYPPNSSSGVYSESEAKAAFDRMVANHGWKKHNNSNASRHAVAAAPVPRLPAFGTAISAAQIAALHKQQQPSTVQQPKQAIPAYHPAPAPQPQRYANNTNGTTTATTLAPTGYQPPPPPVPRKVKRKQARQDVVDLTMMSDDEDNNNTIPANYNPAAATTTTTHRPQKQQQQQPQKRQRQQQQQQPAAKSQRSEAVSISPKPSIEATLDVNDLTEDSLASVHIADTQEQDEDGGVDSLMIQRAQQPHAARLAVLPLVASRTHNNTNRSVVFKKPLLPTSLKQHHRNQQPLLPKKKTHNGPVVNNNNTYLDVDDYLDDEEEDEDSLEEALPPLPPSLPKPTVQERLDAANAKHRLRFELPPEHWDVDEGLLHGQVCYAALPLPHNFNAAANIPNNNGGNNSNEPYVDPNAFAELTVLNHLGADLARKALIQCGNDVDAALLLALTLTTANDGSDGNGGTSNNNNNNGIVELKDGDIVDVMTVCYVGRSIAKLALKKSKGVVPAAIDICMSDPDSLANADQQLQEIEAKEKGLKRELRNKEKESKKKEQESEAMKKKRKEEEDVKKRDVLLREAQKVLMRFEAHGGIRQSRVVRIERIQNLKLYSKFTLARDHIAHDTQRDPNVRQLWHGADRKTLSAIINEGFDIRVANAGALGQGTYFADSSSYSDSYARAPEHGYASAHHRGGALYVPPAAARGAAAAAMNAMNAAGMGGMTMANMSMVGPGVFAATLFPGGTVPGAAPVPLMPGMAGGTTNGTGRGGTGTGTGGGDNSNRLREKVVLGEGLLTEPQFPPNTLSMLLCDVVLGVQAAAPAPCNRRPHPGCHSAGKGGIHCVYDNLQAYPAYIVHYTQS